MSSEPRPRRQTRVRSSPPSQQLQRWQDNKLATSLPSSMFGAFRATVSTDRGRGPLLRSYQSKAATGINSGQQDAASGTGAQLRQRAARSHRQPIGQSLQSAQQRSGFAMGGFCLVRPPRGRQTRSRLQIQFRTCSIPNKTWSLSAAADTHGALRTETRRLGEKSVIPCLPKGER